MNMNSEKKAYAAPQLHELGEHSVVVTTGGSTFVNIDNTYIRDGKSYAEFES